MSSEAIPVEPVFTKNSENMSFFLFVMRPHMQETGNTNRFFNCYVLNKDHNVVNKRTLKIKPLLRT